MDIAHALDVMLDTKDIYYAVDVAELFARSQPLRAILLFVDELESALTNETACVGGTLVRKKYFSLRDLRDRVRWCENVLGAIELDSSGIQKSAESIGDSIVLLKQSLGMSGKCN